ncbi:MAG: protein kinase [Burkholderiales bacterium]|nr:protein kinase [Burkholderiales bacterium]
MSSNGVTASSALPVGARLGEFEITGVIGEGGFGIVYSARDSSLERIVAVKEYLPAAFAGRNSEGSVQVRSLEHNKTFNAGLSSFINEAKMLARFSHPGLVEVFRFWEANGTAYMAMRYYRGVTLREVLRTTPHVVSEQWLCETLDPVLLALQELHNERCYHRDVAPDNIMVLPNGRSVLMDFGAARRIIGGMTQALTTVLKPGYAPIEQYSDDGSMQQGAWTDIYAVGGVLYHAMTGKVPVQAISRMMTDPLKDVAAVTGGKFSPDLCAAVMKCLAVLPENRFQSIDELRTALGWVTTPVSSTVIMRTGYVPLEQRDAASAAVATAAGKAAPAPPPTNAATAVAAKGAATASAAIANGASPAVASDPLADLLSEPSKRAGPITLGPVSPTGDSKKQGGSASDGQGTKVPRVPARAGDSNALPKVLVAVAAVAVLGAAVYLTMSGRGGGAADPGASSATTTPPASSSKPDDVKTTPSSERGETPTAAPAEKPAEVGPAAQSPADAPKADLPVAAPSQPVAERGQDKAAEKAAPADGRVDLRVQPWAKVTVDGQFKGTTPPMTQLKLAPGKYTIVLENPAGAPVTKTVEVVAGKSVLVRHAF